MAYRNNIDPKSPAGKAGFRFGTRGNKLVYVHCGKAARIIRQLVLASSPTEKDQCREFVACPGCFTAARITMREENPTYPFWAGDCKRESERKHLGYTLDPEKSPYFIYSSRAICYF